MNGYNAADITGHRRHHHQLFSPPTETFHLPTNFLMPASSPTLPDSDAQQSFRFPLLSDNQQQQLQQQQISEIIAEPFGSSKFRAGNEIGHQNGAVLPHSLVGFAGVDHSDITARPYRSPLSAPFWSSSSNGMADQQQFHNFQRIGTAMPDYQPQAPELDYQQGSGGEMYESRHFPNPNSTSVAALKCGKCSRDSNAEDEYEKKLDRQLKLMAQSFETQILAHQERLYERFTAKIEEMERRRDERQETRRIAEAERARIQAEARSREQAAAASREAALISCLEEITGRKIELPFAGGVQVGRWPTEEVNALIKVRSEMESRFQKSGSRKNPLWGEISFEMGKMGYQRDAKRCKEKWENIRKYYERKKKKEEEEGGSVKKRRRNKACDYLDKLDQLYCNNGDSKDSSNLDSYSNDNAQNVDEMRVKKDDFEGDGDENQGHTNATVDHPSQSNSEEIATQEPSA